MKKAGCLLILSLVFVCAVLLYRSLTIRFPRAIVVHCSASQWGDASAIREWHRNRGWEDIGYHAIILNGRRTSHSTYDHRLDGKIEPGRPENQHGTHCEADGMNQTALGICLIGDPGKDGYPTQRQIGALVHYCVSKCRKYRIPVSAITQHSDHEPRKPLDASLDMDMLRGRVQAVLDGV